MSDVITYQIQVKPKRDIKWRDYGTPFTEHVDEAVDALEAYRVSRPDRLWRLVQTTVTVLVDGHEKVGYDQ